MKKVLWLIVCLMTMVVSVNAQSEWVTEIHAADELTGTDEYTSVSYIDGSNGIVTWSTESKKFRIICGEEMFDSKIQRAGWNPNYRSLFEAVVGLYSTDGKLIKKKYVTFEIGANHHQGMSVGGRTGKNEGKIVLDYLRNKKGYIRIVAPLSGTNTNFDMKVPCMNN